MRPRAGTGGRRPGSPTTTAPRSRPISWDVKNLASSLPLFLTHLRHECGLSANTVDAYARDLRRFFAWLETTGVQSWQELGIGPLGTYLGWLAEEQLAASSVARHVASLKMFFRFLVLEIGRAHV